jgi:CubicO group peptidase (beta-lactamase class C family)
MKSLFYFFLLIIFTACGSVSNPDTAVNNLELKTGVTSTQIDSTFQALRYFPNRTQLSIALVNDSAVTFYGAIRSNDTLQTINNSSRAFEIGSLSKVFTSTLLADLAIENKLQLDDPIQRYLSFPLNDSLQITFKQLANHTSGLPRIPSGFVWESLWHLDNPYKDYDEHRLREYMSKEMTLRGQQDSTFQYSNIGAGILGYTLEQIEGKSYEEMLQQRIFRPLGMQHSITHRQLVKDILVQGLNKRGNTTSNWDLGAIPGAGGILSTAEDLAEYVRANLNTDNNALNLQKRNTYSVNESRDMALGWFIRKQDNKQLHWHSGGTGGYRSIMVLDVNARRGVVVLSNISSGHEQAGRISSLGFALLKSIKTTDLSQN